MSKTVKTTVIVALLLFFGFFLGVPFLIRILGPPSLGKGSYKHAKLWRDKLVACDSLDDVRTHFNCGRWESTAGGNPEYIDDPNTFKEGNTWALLYEFPDGEWLAMAYADSHNTWGGGTVVTRDNAGQIRVFFGHVCGMPQVFGDSLEAVYESLASHPFPVEEVSLRE